ncbi:hypothetical protein ACFQL1_22975 [Halomicroarcula sp. GCM10025709]|uniref:hypothetical protein n=1 Tax=Haloarcula TaxID=2237 RepID=UPI0024C31455|nr:hypothetical protein [Halomicroarcula sp. YJ-61-S]
MFDDIDGPEQTTLVRTLIVLAIALPILIEVATFGSLLSHSLLGVGGDAGGAATATATPTAEIEGASVGDEVLPATPAVERIDRAAVVTGEDGWRFVLTVAVSNPTDHPYELRLGEVHTRDGETVAGGATTGTVAAGGNGTVTGAWVLPTGHQPETVAVTAVDRTADGAETETYSIRLGSVQLSNG